MHWPLSNDQIAEKKQFAKADFNKFLIGKELDLGYSGISRQQI